MNKSNVSNIYFDMLPAVKATYDNFEAIICPALGANVVKFIWKDDNGVFEILHGTARRIELISNPYNYGVPILFPPNRMQNASFTYDGITYSFPVNCGEKDHIHGVLHNLGWELVSADADSKSARVKMRINTAKNPILSTYFPIELVFERLFELSSEGLTEKFTIYNYSEFIYPSGVAYHTAFHAPIDQQKDIKVRIPLERQCEDDIVTRFPSGKYKELDETEKAVASKTGCALSEINVDKLYTASNLEDTACIYYPCGKTIHYQHDKNYQYWILSTLSVDKAILTIEPQSYLSNIYSFPQEEWEKYGIINVKPKGKHTFTTRISVVKG